MVDNHNRRQTEEPTVTNTETQVEQAIRELMNRKAPRKDNINKKLLKNVRTQLIIEVTKLFQKMLEKKELTKSITIPTFQEREH